MTIVKYKNQSGQIYAYEQTSYWDPEKQQSRPKRKYLGRVDPETGEIISTENKRGRPPKATDPGDPQMTEYYKKQYETVLEKLDKAQKELEEVKASKDELVIENKKYRKLIDMIHEKTIL